MGEWIIKTHWSSLNPTLDEKNFFLCTLVISFQCLSEEIEKKGNHEVGMNESPLEGVKHPLTSTSSYIRSAYS